MTTIATVAPSFEPATATSLAGTDTTIEVTEGLAAAAAVWRALEQDAVMSPYGRLDWIAAFATTLPAEASAVRVVVLRDDTRRPVLLMPFTIERRLGIRIATAIGGRHANYNLPLMRADAAGTLTGAEARAVLRKAGQRMGVDAVAIPHVPVSWNGAGNPFAAGGRPSPSDAWSLRLERDGDTTLARSMSPDARKKLRNKSRGLAKLGPVDLLVASNEAEVDLILDAFFEQKEKRFRQMGIADPFAGPEMRAFLRGGALARLAEGCPPVELYGLTVAGRVVAVLGGAADARRLSGMFLSFEDGDAAKFSPGEILVTNVIRMQCGRGREVFDLGVGDARYKRSICDTAEPLVDVTVPVTLRGRLYEPLHGAAVEAKRRIKASPRAMGIVVRTRRALASLRGARPAVSPANRPPAV